MTHYESVAQAQDVILDTAAQIANREWNELQNSPWNPAPGERFNQDARRKRWASLHGDVFRADQDRSEQGGLCLSLDEAIVEGATKEEIDTLHRIGREAIVEALRWHPDLLGGMIVGEARKGRNYFDRFPADPQTRLF